MPKAKGETPAVILGWKWKDSQFHTSPFGRWPLPCNSFWEVVESSQKRLATLKRDNLSIGGRISLIKATVTNLPIYFLSIFKIPSWQAEKIKELQKNFLWDRGDASGWELITWEKVWCHTLKRGLGYGDCGKKLGAVKSMVAEVPFGRGPSME